MTEIIIDDRTSWQTPELKEFVKKGFVTESSFVDLVERNLESLWPESGEDLAYELVCLGSRFGNSDNVHISTIRGILGSLEATYDGGIAERKADVDEIRKVIKSFNEKSR